MEKIEKYLLRYSFLIIILLSIPAIWALFVPGFYGASDDIHIAWLHQMDAALKTGQLPPRFVPDLSFGFGYPLFNFVFPLPFYFAEIIHLLGFSLVNSIKAVFILSLPLSGYLMYRLLKELTKPFLALAGAVVYIYTPYRATDIYVRGAIGEIVAFVVLPLCIWSTLKVTDLKNKDNRWIGIFAFSIALLITSHNIITYMFLPFLLLLLFARLYLAKSHDSPAIKKSFSGLILGFLLSIYFWLPAMIESRLMKYDTVFNYYDHFPTLKQLMTPYFGYGASVPGPYDGMSFFVGIVNILLIVAAIIILIVLSRRFNKDIKIVFSWSFLVLLSAIFMMNHRSAIIWENIPFIGYFQFPWRFLTLITLISPIFVIVFTKFKSANYLAVIIVASSILFNFSYFKPNEFLGRQDDYFLNRYIPKPVASIEYFKTSEEYLRLPLNTQKRPDRNYPRVTSNSGQLTNISLINDLDAEFEIDSIEESAVSYNKYMFPGWRAKVDGQNIVIKPASPFGQITFKVPAGYHKIEVSFNETPFRKILNTVSLIGLILVIVQILKPKIFNKFYL